MQACAGRKDSPLLVSTVTARHSFFRIASMCRIPVTSSWSALLAVGALQVENLPMIHSPSKTPRLGCRTALLLCLSSFALEGCGSTSSNSTATDTSATTSSSQTTSSSPGTSSQPDANPTSPPVSPSSTSESAGSVSSEGGESSTSEEPTTNASDEDSSVADTSETPSPTTEPTVAADSFEVDVQLASEVDEKAPTTVGIVTWSTTLSGVDGAYVEFGPTTDYGTQASVDLSVEDHRTLLLGMKPSATYHFRVVATGDGGPTASADYTLETGAETTDVSIGSFEVLDETKREVGFTVASYWSGVGSAVAFILDQDGEIVWAYDTGITGGIARARLSDDGKNLWVISASNNGAALHRVGIDGLGGETYAANIGSHDITAVTGETMAFIEYGETDCDSIFEIDPSGTVKEVWDSEELNVGGGGSGTRCHGNALRYSEPEGLYTFSDVSTDIVKVTREGELTWKLTELVAGGNETWGGAQHGHHLLKDSIVVFANSGAASKAGPSAVIEYALADGAELWRYEGADGELSANLGDAQRLPGGNTLVTFSNDSIVHEVTPEKEVVVAWKGSPNSRIGYTEWRSSLYGQSPIVHD